MPAFTRLVVLLVGLLAMGAALADSKPNPPTKQQIAQWIKELGDANFDTRQKASDEIWKATDDETSPQIEAALKEALKSDDAEVVRRASEVLDRLQIGIHSKTPKKIVDLAEQFRGADDAARAEAIKGLFASGAPGLKVLLKLIDSEKDPDVKNALGQQVATQALTAIPTRMAEDDRASVEQLLDLGVHSNLPAATLSYAAYWLRRGKLAERIATLEAVKAPNPESHAALLATLFRVQGDFKKAREAAERSKNEELLQAVLFDQGDWKELADRAAKASVGSNDPNVLGLLAYYQRLAGDIKGADETLGRIRENAKQTDHEQTARALLLNGRPAHALELINTGKGRLNAVEMYCARYQFKEALRIFEAKEPPRDPEVDPKELEVLHARTLYLLGDQENAVKLFKSLGENIGKKTAPLGQETIETAPPLLIPTELRLGLKELAYQHSVAGVTGHQNHPDVLANLLEPVFPDRGQAAATWWQYLRHKHSKDEPADTMKRLREVLDGRLSLKEFTPLAEDALQLAGDLPPERRVNWFHGLADSCADAGADTVLKTCLEKMVVAPQVITGTPGEERPSAAPGALLRLGDYFAGKKDWSHAAERYGEAWEKDRKAPLPAYLRGRALVEAGQEKEGKRPMELAHDLPLADAGTRYTFARDLDKRGYADAARLECELLLRVNGFDDPWHTEEALKALAQYARAEKNYAKAADYYERSLLCHFHGESDYGHAVGNLVVPAAVHYNRAMAFLTAGKRDEAVREIQTCLEITRGDINLAILLLPELAKKGYSKEADDLFATVRAVHEGLCKDYPKSAWAHNNTAWLAVCCRRNLDEALTHAKRAVELAPENAGYLDTLAEVYFQKGDKDKALELTKRCIKLDPKKAYFQRQLKRIEAGDPSVDVPE